MALKTRKFGMRSAVIAGSVILAATVFGVSSWRADANLVASAPAPMPVAAFRAEYDQNASIDEYFPGLISARRESALGFERGGRIDEIAVDVGDRVEAGDVIARLDTRALNAQIAAADAQTAEAAAQTALARETEDRQQQLLANGHISAQRLAEVETSTQAAQARENAAAAAADALRVQLDLSEIIAPFDGVIAARHVDEGAIASPGLPVVEIVESDALEIRVGLPPHVASRFQSSETYRFVTDGGDLLARFRASTGVVDRQTRTVTALFDVTATDRVAAGQVVRLVVETPIEANGFWVPTSALVEGRRGLWSLYTLVEDEEAYRLESRVVETVRIETDRVFVRGAVEQGDMILETGVQRVIPGQRVAPAAIEARNP